MHTQPALLPNVEDKQLQDRTHAEQYAALEHTLRETPWGEDMVGFIARGYSWHKAAFIAWAMSAPRKGERQPPTQKEFAQFIGVGDGTVSDWANDPVIKATIAAGHISKLAIENDANVFTALAESASNPDYHHSPDRRLYFEIRGIIKRPGMEVNVNTTVGQQTNVDYSQFTEEELEQMRKNQTDD